MADLSKIKLNGVEYDLKDAVARGQLGDIVFVTFTDIGRDFIEYEADMTYLECLSALNNGKKLIGVIINRYYNSKTFAFCRKPQDRIDELYFYYQSIDSQIGKITYDNNNNITPNFINIPQEVFLLGSDSDGNPMIHIDSYSLQSGNNCENPYALHGITLPNGEENLIQIINQMENYDKDLTFNFPLSSGTFALTSQIPTKTSDLTNDAGYITSYTETDPTVPAWAKQANKPTYTAAEVGALPDTTVIPAAQVNADWDATSGVAQILHKPTIPTVPTNVSAFTNDSGYLTSYTETDPTVPAWAKAESKPTYTAQEVGALPADTIIPTVPTNVSAFTNDAGYLTSYTETDPTVPSWAKASTKPIYTASEVGAATSDHVHGNVKNNGTITVNSSMANGDRLLFSDTSDSSKIKNTSITIGTSTTQYLANNGTWQNLPTVSVSQTLTSGTEIGSVNSTKLYAPAPYNDSALAARVTALEQLEWATYYSGRSNPSNSQGQNGDIYLQY